MSLILDALRKADAERERGAVPGLHAHPADLGAADAIPPARTPPWLWAGIGIAVGVVVAIALAAWVVGRSGPPPAVATAPAGAPIPASTAANTPAPPGAAPAPASTPATTQMPPLAAEPAPWPTADARKPGDRKGSAARADASAAPAAAPITLTAEPAALAYEQLPANIRAQLPQLSFGGSIYSSSAASRSLIVNGRLHREGEEVAPGLVLEQIRPKGAVFGFRGTRFEVQL